MWLTSYSLYTVLATLVDRLDGGAMQGAEVIPWGCPVPSFGDPSTSSIATLGINPSNREFVNKLGQELRGLDRRFHTLGSLGLGSWSGADATHLSLILDSCNRYFYRNPYNDWFKKLDSLLSGMGVSYYSNPSTACHFDLIPYATTRKWSDLSEEQRSLLAQFGGDTLGLILRDSTVNVLILNGRSVVEGFERISGCRLAPEPIADWSLARRSNRDVPGVAYTGTVSKLAGVHLGRQVMVIGYNHNLQGSFGVSNEVIRAMKNWLAQTVEPQLW